jgi:hypothetical protein
MRTVNRLTVNGAARAVHRRVSERSYRRIAAPHLAAIESRLPVVPSVSRIVSFPLTQFPLFCDKRPIGSPRESAGSVEPLRHLRSLYSDTGTYRRQDLNVVIPCFAVWAARPCRSSPHADQILLPFLPDELS